MAVSVSNVNLMERVCHLTNKIYREILRITTNELERPRMTYITIYGLDHVRVSTFSWASQYKITLSWDLLDWMAGMYGIPWSDSFSEHISRALPTEMKFYLLRSIPSESLILYSGNLKFDMLEAIIKWLQVSVSEYATDQSEI